MARRRYTRVGFLVLVKATSARRARRVSSRRRHGSQETPGAVVKAETRQTAGAARDPYRDSPLERVLTDGSEWNDRYWITLKAPSYRSSWSPGAFFISYRFFRSHGGSRERREASMPLTKYPFLPFIVRKKTYPPNKCEGKNGV